MNTLVTICARGGSKGVKDKNIRPLMGKPLIAYTIGQAKSWDKADHVIVSTDSPQIAAVARDFGAEIPFLRPAELATDTSGKLAVIRHAARECESLFKTRFDLVVDLDVTSPIRKKEDLDRCYEIFSGKNPDVLFSVVRAHKNPYFNMVELNRDGYAELSKHLPQEIYRRQDAPLVYSMNASIYFFRRDFLFDEGNSSLFSGRALIYEMDDLSALDIDREIDFQFLEFLTREGAVCL